MQRDSAPLRLRDLDRDSAYELGSARLEHARSRRGRKRPPASDYRAQLILGAAGAGLGLVLVDRAFRPAWDVPWGDHWLGAPLLLGSVAAIFGIALIALVELERWLTRGFLGEPRRRDLWRAGFRGAIAGVLVSGAASYAFQGEWIRTKPGAAWGPPIFTAFFSAGVALLSYAALRAEWRSLRQRTAVPALLGATGFGFLATFCFWADMNWYVDLYDRLHTVLEVSGAACLFGATYGVVLSARTNWPRLAGPLRGLSWMVALVAAWFGASRSFRSYTDGLLAHAWVDRVYLGRTLERAQRIELTMMGEEVPLEMARMGATEARFQVKDKSVAPEYSRAMLGIEPRQSLARVKNIAIFYVDTLRYDVSVDSTLMPSLARLRAQALDFSAAYSAGSDTLRALPALTSGCYHGDRSEGDLLALARRHSAESILVGPQSALEFLDRHAEEFRFETTVRVPDYAEGRADVWGYGADQSSAARVVDEAIAQLEKRRSEAPFFLWMFHFDQHAWRELSDAYIKEQNEKYRLPKKGAIDLRYRLVARAIDHELGRFLDAMDRLGLAEETAILFVSDHGEGLGRAGFWVHSVFLWDALVHVPLVLRVPGIAPKKRDEIVSLVDVAPTLAPLLGSVPPESVYHGVDLLAPEFGEAVERRLPILLRAAKRDRLERIGLIDPKTRRKLVLQVEAALPELFQVPNGSDDTENLAKKEPERVRSMVQELARSPIYPRRPEDFDLLASSSESSPLGAPPP